MKIYGLAKFITDLIFTEKEIILEAYESEDRESLESEIYYCLESCAEDGEQAESEETDNE